MPNGEHVEESGQERGLKKSLLPLLDGWLPGKCSNLNRIYESLSNPLLMIVCSNKAHHIHINTTVLANIKEHLLSAVLICKE